MEEWRQIENSPFCEVSNMGRVRTIDHIDNLGRHKKGRILKQNFDSKKKYLHVRILIKGKYKTVNIHRLVAKAFVPNPENLPEVNHKDENKKNNTSENLEWCTRKYNNNYGTKRIRQSGEHNAMSKFSECMIRDVVRQYIPKDQKYGLKPLSEKYGISRTHLCSIIKGRRWKNVLG